MALWGQGPSLLLQPVLSFERSTTKGTQNTSSAVAIMRVIDLITA